MSTTENRETAPADGASVDHRLARLLDTPSFLHVVPHLAPETLHQLIHYRGLDACGELVTAATPAQLQSLLDLDLWRHAQPGRDERFDVERFGEWLEVLVDTGDSAAARAVAAIDPHVVIVGLSRYVRVFDPGTFEPTESSDDETFDRHQKMISEGSADVPECEVGGYLIRARRTDAWDAIIALLVSIEIEHHDYFHAVMQGCRRLSNSAPEIDGLDDLLPAAEQHLHDVVVERERRRARQGYTTPAEARAFLHMARRPRTPGAPMTTNPIAAAYFRAAEEGQTLEPHDAPHSNATDSGGGDPIAASIGTVVELLAEAGMVPGRPRALLQAADADPRARTLPHLHRLMEFLLQQDESTYLARRRELAFLANTLLAGASIQSRPFTPQEASDAAACICNLGLECGDGTATRPDGFLVDHDLVAAFEAGWSALYNDVALFAADQLVSVLDDLQCSDADIRRDLRSLRRTLDKERQAGTPWLARDAVDALTMLDMTASISVLGLLDECPVVPAALTAVLERRSTLVSPAAFEFISSTAQISDVRLFMTMLPHILSR